MCPLPVVPVLVVSSRSTGVISDWVRDYLHDPASAWHALALQAPFAVSTVAILVALTVAARRWWRGLHHARLVADARVVTVAVPPTVDPAGGVALWSNLLGLARPAWKRMLFGQPHLACEYLMTHNGVTIRWWIPGVIPPDLVEHALQAAWPGAHTRTEPAGPPLPSGDEGVTTGGQLRLARPEMLPLRTDFDADPLRALLAAGTGLRPGEAACVQILARPAARYRGITARRSQHSPGVPTRLLGELLDLLTPGPSRTRSHATRSRATDPQVSVETSARSRAMVAKRRGGLYDTLLYYAVTTPVPADAGPDDRAAARQRVRGLAHGLAAAFAGFGDHNHYTRRRLPHPTAAVAQRRLGRGDLLSVDELAAIAHLPDEDTHPGLHRAGARALAPPPGIATTGADVLPLGQADAGPVRPVGLRLADARHHLHVLGATGSGKSTLLAQMILAHAHAGRGCIVLDPKGDLITDVLDRLPAHAVDRVELFDADTDTPPPCLNPLEGANPDRVVDNLVSVFRRVYAAFWGPRTDDILRAACLTLCTQNTVPTLKDLPRLLGDPAFRRPLVAGVADPILRGFWSWYDELSDGARSQAIAPLMNKLRAFLLRPFVRDALTAGASTVDIDEVLDGGLCLVRIPKGTLGEDTMQLIGSLIVARTWQATTARARLPQAHRRDAALVLDECQNFLHLPYALDDMLAEARGYRLSITLAHQHLGQLSRDLREGIATNARTKIVFTASPDDARELARHTTPALTDHDLAHLDAFHAAARLVSHGEHARPFTLTTTPLPPATPQRTGHVRCAASHGPRRSEKPPATRTRRTTPRSDIDPRRNP